MGCDARVKVATGLSIDSKETVQTNKQYYIEYDADTIGECRICNGITIDGCEYLVFHYYHNFGITHKGNCTNTIHRYRQQ